MNNGWADGPMLGFDLETTSLQLNEARIVTASVVAVWPGGEWEQPGNWVVNPGIEIPAETTEIHGVTTEYAQEHGRPTSDVVIEVVTKITEAWSNGWPVVSFNAPYHLTVLQYELRRCHYGQIAVVLTEASGSSVGPVIDPLVIDRHVDRFRSGSRTLKAECAYYEIDPTVPHASVAHARAAVLLVRKIAERYPEIGVMTLTELQNEQVKWYDEFQREYARYLRRKADFMDRDADGWPIRKAS